MRKSEKGMGQSLEFGLRNAIYLKFNPQISQITAIIMNVGGDGRQD
jgi:hypothetical protein